MSEYSPKQISTEELYSTFEIAQVLRAVPNPNLDIYQAISADRNILLKKFKPDKDEALKREIEQYRLFSSVPFVPQPALIVIDRDGSYLGYDWIEGSNLYDYLRANNHDTSHIDESILLQIVELGNAINDEKFASLVNAGSKFSLQNPLSRNVLDPIHEENFDIAYKPVRQELLNGCNLYPGIYTDRNPGNIIMSSDNNIYHVDFGLVEATSPLFDLTKYLRTRTGEPSLHGLANDNSPQQQHVLNHDNELKTVAHAYTLLREVSKYSVKENFSVFAKAYYYAAFNEHIFYLSKALHLFQTGEANQSVQQSRLNYHSYMLEHTFDYLLHEENVVGQLYGSVQNLLELTSRLDSRSYTI